MHDIGESRTSDLNYVHQRYGRLAESQAVDDIAKALPFGKEIQEAFLEEQARKTLEAKIAKDVSAGMMLTIAIGAVGIAGYIFIPYVFPLLLSF